MKRFFLDIILLHIDILLLFMICMYSYEQLLTDVEWLSITQWVCVFYAVVFTVEIFVVQAPAMLGRFRSLNNLDFAMKAACRGIETSATLSACQGEVFSFSTLSTLQFDNLLNFGDNSCHGNSHGNAIHTSCANILCAHSP